MLRKFWNQMKECTVASNFTLPFYIHLKGLNFNTIESNNCYQDTDRWENGSEPIISTVSCSGSGVCSVICHVLTKLHFTLFYLLKFVCKIDLQTTPTNETLKRFCQPASGADTYWHKVTRQFQRFFRDLRV